MNLLLTQLHCKIKGWLFLFLVLGIFLISCKKELPAKILKKDGKIYGNINILFNDDQNFDHNVQIKLEGPEIQRTVQVNSEYSIFNLPDGNYKLTFSKPNFGKVEIYNVTVFDGDSVYVPTINMVPYLKFPVIPATLNYNNQDQGSIYFHAKGNGQYSNLIMFISTANNVTCNRYQEQREVYYNYEQQTFFINKYSTFANGTKLYGILYGISLGDYGYFNFYYGLKIFSSINPEKHSDVFNFTLRN